MRKLYYRFLSKISNSNLTIDTTGSGIYDKKLLKYLDLLKINAIPKRLNN